MQNLVRPGITANTWDMYCADDDIERRFWGGDWRPANRFETIGIAEALAVSDIALADEADWLDYIDIRSSARFGFALI